MTESLWDHFHQAARVLVGAGPVKQRLLDAYRTHLAWLRDQDFPEAVRNDFVELRASLHYAQAAGGLGALEVAVRKMSEQDATGYAEEILRLFAMLTMLAEREAAAAKRLRVVGGGDDGAGSDELPAYLNRA